ncbi:hypothetical protein NFI96_000950 [Prochilodus magdalenae]|nr:hypothetical protein NFI96_000950 [Prochilodus magdalenae]
MKTSLCLGSLFCTGKAGCPYFAKAELLADSLERTLPDFHMHKICVPSSDWKDWLEETCSSRGWTHESCPIVWRELVDRGGKGMLLGGVNDFLEFVQRFQGVIPGSANRDLQAYLVSQGYYGISSDMGTELMMTIAGENLQATEQRLEEEERQRNLLRLFHVWISGALNPTCYSLIPLLFTAGVFRDVPISLHLLDTESCEESLLGLKMEVEDLALPQLHQVTIHCDLTQAFQSAELIIFLEEWPSNPERKQDDEEQMVTQVTERFDRYSHLIEANAQRDVRVMVAGDTYVNLKCSLLIENASSVDPSRFVAMATQMEYEARAQLAEKLSVKTSDITDVIIWGNISGTSHIDLQRAKVLRYKGAIWGPPGFSQPVCEVVYDRVEQDWRGEQSPVGARWLLITVSEEQSLIPDMLWSPGEVVSDPGDQVHVSTSIFISLSLSQ